MKREAIYIAGPECFYKDGNEQLNAMRRLAEACGYDVTLPNDVPLKLDHTDLRRNADAIFQNCANSINASTAVICDLEFYRGPEVDGGSSYELGMACARGIRCYGYTRDKRDMKWKYQGIELRNGVPYDRKGRVLPYYDLPFSPNVIGSTRIVEGDFAHCLRLMGLDIEEERKHGGVLLQRHEPPVPRKAGDGRPVAYLSGPDRFDPDAAEKYAAMKRRCAQYGLCPVTPLDPVPWIDDPPCPDDPYARAYRTFLRNRQHVYDCDLILANLNDFHGWEPESDTSFECGMAFQLGKKLFAYMDSTVRMRDRVPNCGEAGGWRDICGCNVENFDYPLNLMFSSSMRVVEGDFEKAAAMVAALAGKAACPDPAPPQKGGAQSADC